MRNPVGVYAGRPSKEDDGWGGKRAAMRIDLRRCIP